MLSEESYAVSLIKEAGERMGSLAVRVLAEDAHLDPVTAQAAERAQRRCHVHHYVGGRRDAAGGRAAAPLPLGEAGGP